MRFASLNRYQAALIHLGLSAAIATATFVVIYFLWFPGALFAAAGGLKLFFLIAGVDVCLGPLLTLTVFVPGKKGLEFDLAVIAMLQVAGLTYGVYMLSQARPVYVAFVRDRFELARANHIAPEELEKARANGYGRLPLTGPRVVGTRLPTDPDEQFRIANSGLAGIDLQGYPQYFVPYEQVRAEVLKHAQPLSRLRALNPPDKVERALARLERPDEGLRFLPMRAGVKDLAVVVDARTGDVVRLLNLQPW